VSAGRSQELRALWRHPFTPLILLLLLLPHLITQVRATVTLATEILIFILLGLGFNLLLGYTGLVSFGHGAYFGLAAYAGSLVQIHLTGGVGLPILAGLLFGTATGAVVGFLIMRKRGVYFALLTLAFTQMFFYIVFRWTNVTGGESGLGGVKRPAINLAALGVLNLDSALVYYHLVLLVVVAGAYLIWRIVHSPFGRVLEAIRENEQRASFVGYNTKAYKFTAFVLSCAATSLAGILYALLIRFVYPETVHVNFSGEILAMTVVGGMRHFLGPAVGGAFFVFFRDFLSAYTENWLVFFGALFMLFILLSPEGICGLVERLAGLLGFGAEAGKPVIPPRPTRNAGPAGPPVAATAPGGPDPVSAGSPVLVCQGLQKRFGALRAVDGVDLTVRRGELRSVIGPNGAGKTTLFNCVTTLFPVDDGRAIFGGVDITNRLPHHLVRRGLARSFQIISLFQALPVFENVRIAVQARTRYRFSLFAWADDLAEINAETWQFLDDLGLSAKADMPANSLSHGDQRLLEIGIALATRPTLLLLDEPLAGLSAGERTRVAELIRRLAGQITVVLIEHDIDRVLALSDSITVLHQGRVIAEGSPAEIQQNPEVQAAYLGGLRPAAAPAARPVPRGGEPLLEVERINTAYGKSHILREVSLHVFPGEVVALLGRNGAGKTTTLASIMGAVPPRSGVVRFRGEAITRRPPEEIARLGIGLVPQGRRIFPNLTVLENLELAARPRANGGWTAGRVFELFPALGTLRASRGDQLSGGERQMLAVGRALMGNADLLLLDEPFEGLAPTVIEVVVRALEELRKHATLLLVEQNAQLALGLADRAYVLSNGAVEFRGPAAELATDLDLRVKLLGV
jgi:ABC-type branched-subunit amino acid transport system ATPase component/ABC-type branched-subunit amino acid transport system permease subunit